MNASPASVTIDLVTLKPYLSKVTYDDLIHYPETELNASEYYNPDDDLCRPVILTVMGIGVDGFPNPNDIETIVDAIKLKQPSPDNIINEAYVEDYMAIRINII